MLTHVCYLLCTTSLHVLVHMLSTLTISAVDNAAFDVEL